VQVASFAVALAGRGVPCYERHRFRLLCGRRVKRCDGDQLAGRRAPICTVATRVARIVVGGRWAGSLARVLRQVAEGVLIHESEFCQSNAVVVQGRAGVLLIDAGVNGYEIACLANDLRELGQPVVAGFSTHPHWDHLLWHARLGAAPRYGTARCAAAVRDRLSDAGARARIAALIPPDIAEQVPLACSASLPACPPRWHRFHGMALKSGSSSIKRMPRAMRRC
jgi:hypothetical protein